MAGPVAVVAAHPDDETIGAGASLHLFDRLTLVHVTDGAPRDLGDAHAAGFDDAPGYAAARRGELLAALDAACVSPRCVALEIADQGATHAMARIAAALRRIIVRDGVTSVLTHAYEGGHPDHDATAWAVHAACRSCAPPPAIIEFASYHASPDGGIATGAFLPNGAAPTVVPLDARAQAAKRCMLDCFVSQRATLSAFGVTHEAFRPAPAYDFSEPPHEGTLHYERHDWGMTGARWRCLAPA